MNRIKQLRVAKGIDSLRDLSYIITTQYGFPLGFANLGRIESGRNDNPKYKTLAALANFFDVSIEYLMGDSDDPHGDGRRRDGASKPAKDELPQEAQIAIDTFINKLKDVYKVQPQK